MKLSSDKVIYEKISEKNGAIAKIWFNRPEEGNKINHEMFLALDQAVNEAIRDPEVRVVVFGGKGDHFCSGFDAGDPETSLNNNEAGVISWMDRRANTQEEIDLFMKIYNMRKPTIGATQGSVLGGGWFMAMMFDCIIAADTTVYDNLEFALGMGYTIYLPFDAWKIPMNIAKQKAFTGEATTAEEGYRYGLFNQVVPVDKLEDAAMRLARRMMRLSPYTLAAHKEIYNLAYSLKGIQNIVPFAKETFSIGMELPGTPENQAMWEYARKVGPEKFRQYFAEKIAEVAEEDKKPL